VTVPPKSLRPKLEPNNLSSFPCSSRRIHIDFEATKITPLIDDILFRPSRNAEIRSPEICAVTKVRGMEGIHPFVVVRWVPDVGVRVGKLESR
jgi:hypothetical protein